MSVKQDSVSVQIDKTPLNVKVLRGRTGNIVKVLSDRTAVFRDKVYGDVTFTEDEVKFSVVQKGSGFRSYFPEGRVVYFDIEVDDVRNVKCINIWVSRKQESNSSSSQPISYTHRTAKLIDHTVYRGTVIKMRCPFAFVVEIDDSKNLVFVFNQAFKPNQHAGKLCRDEPVSLYVSKGDTVYVKVYKNTSGKEFEWSAWDAWMEGDDALLSSTSSKKKEQQRKRTRKPEGKTCTMKGQLGFVGIEAAHLVSAECNDTVFFHRDTAFLFGVPMKGLRLDQIFRTGEEMSFLLSKDVKSEASCVWFGSRDSVSLSLRERTNCIMKYCRERGIDPLVLTTIVQELGKQRLPDEGKQKLEEEEEEIYDSYSTRVLNEFAAVTHSQKELSGSTASKFDANQVVSSDTTEQSTLSATTATSNIVQGSALNISAITPATKERSFVAITKQNMTANQETNCIVTTALSTSSVTASKQIIGIATAATKQRDSVVTATTAAAVENFENENNFTVTAASKTFMDSTEDAKIITNFLEPKSEVKTDSLKDNSNATSRTVTQTTKAHYEVKNSTAASISEKTDSKSHDHRHMDLRKIRSQSCVSDTESEILCGDESEFHMSLINTDIEYNLEVSLLTVLTKEVGESASLILAPHVIGCFKKELNCVVHELMMKAISSVVDNITEHCNQDENLHCESATGVTRISNMAQKWNKELMLIADKQRAEKENEMATLLDRAHKYRKRMSVLCLSDKVSQSNSEESNGNSCIINNGDKNESYVNDSINFVPDGYGDGTTENSSLVGIVQDFLLLQNTTDSHMVGTQKCVSDQETQTISTGSVLYLKHLPDL